MRALLLIALCASTAAANPLRHRDPEVRRPDLKTVTIVRTELENSKRVEIGTETRTYDKAGQVTSIVHRARGKVIVRTDYVWKHGRIAKHVYTEPGKRKEVRLYTYKVDSGGRVLEKTMRDPSAPKGELHVTMTTWSADGSRIERRTRHYAKEGPYDNGSASYDAKGRLETECRASGGCDMPSYDAHGVVTKTRQEMGDGEHAYISQDNTYDANDRLTQIKRGTSTTTFTYDANGNVASETGSGGDDVYTYVRR